MIDKKFKQILERDKDLKKIRIHDLRHSHASLLINQGEDYLVVKERLGHASITTTIDTYSHLCTLANRKHWLINLMIYFKMEKIGNSTHNKEKKTRSENLVFNTIPAAGVEPARPCGHWILSPARLPIPPRRQIVTGVAGFEPTHEGVKVPCLTAWLYPNNIK